MTALLEYLDLSILVARHCKDLEGAAPPLATPLKIDMAFEDLAKFRGMLL